MQVNSITSSPTGSLATWVGFRPVAVVCVMRHSGVMFDWTDLFLLLPSRVFWACFAAFIVVAALLVMWAVYL